MKNQVQELGVWLGNVFIGTIGRILPYINGFVMALVAVVKTLAIFVGYTNTGSGLAEGLQEAETASNGISSGIGGAAKKAKELKQTLMGFDVLNVIQTPQTSSGGGGGGGSPDAIDPKILNALKDYDNLMGSVQMKATIIRDRIMEWLGFNKEVNEETGEITWKLKDGYTRLNLILDLIKLIGLTLLSWKISRNVTSFFEKLGVLEKTKGFKIALELTLLITGITIVFNGIKNMLKGDLSASNLLKSLGGSALAGVGAGLLFTGPIGWTVGIGLSLITAITYSIKSDQELMPEIAKAEGLNYDGMTFQQNMAFRLDLALQVFGLKEAKNPIAKEMKRMISETIKGASEWLKNLWNTIQKWFEELPGKILHWLGEIAGEIANYLTTEFPKKLDEFRTWMTVTAPNKVKEFFTVTIPNLWNKFVEWLKGIDLKEIATNIVQGFINGLKEKWNEMVSSVNGWIANFIEGFKEGVGVHSPSTTFADIGKNVIQGFFNGLKDKWDMIKTKIGEWIEELKKKFDFSNIKIKTPHISWSSNGSYATGTLAKILSTLNLPTQLPRLSVSWYQTGGFPKTGQLFAAREAGPELVGSIGNRTAVVNNQQIVEAVSSGVASAVASVLGNGGSSYQLIIDGEQITNVVQRRIARQANITGMAMGV